MSHRRLAFSVLILASGVALMVAVSTPFVFAGFMAGGFAPQYGGASLLSASPVAAVLVAFAIGLSAGIALLAPPRRQRRVLTPLGITLIASALMATAYMFSPIARVAFYPLGLAVVGLGGLSLLLAARCLPAAGAWHRAPPDAGPAS